MAKKTKIELRTGPWRLKDLDSVPKNGKKVFSCFHCGGGSTMGYKLAGFDVLGGVEIDEEMMSLYRANHHPKHSYHMGVAEFNDLPDEDIPAELFDIDILDGSPPCSSFSMAGAREKKWGVEKKFREGQVEQVLDDLFFHYLRTVEKLKPKVVVAENVKGLVSGNARGYVKEILARFGELGYDVQIFLLNAARMGVPQRRERVFFIARRKDMGWPKINLNFDEPLLALQDVFDRLEDRGVGKPLPPSLKALWELATPGVSYGKYHARGSFFNNETANPKKQTSTLTATLPFRPIRWERPEYFSDIEVVTIQSFPDDYNFMGLDPQYVCGMSVPPFMMQRIAFEIAQQWLG